MAKAGTVLPAGASIAPQDSSATDPKKKKGAKPASVLAALNTQLASPALTFQQQVGAQV